MTANDSTPSEGKDPAESIDDDRELRLWRFIDDHADMLADLAQQARRDDTGHRLMHADSLEEAAECWRELSREAEFYADVIDELRDKNTEDLGESEEIENHE